MKRVKMQEKITKRKKLQNQKIGMTKSNDVPMNGKKGTKAKLKTSMKRMKMAHLRKSRS